MEGKGLKGLVMVMLVITLFGNALITTQAIEICSASCPQECLRLLNHPVYVSICGKYCDGHCGAHSSIGGDVVKFCNLGCMLSQCAKFHNDEVKQERCIANCRVNHCKL